MTPALKESSNPPAFLVWIHQLCLSFYPKSFRDQYGTEMQEIFLDAYCGRRRNGIPPVAELIMRKMLDTLGSAFAQHLNQKFFWVRPYPFNSLVFTFPYVVLSLLELTNAYYGLMGISGFVIYSLSYLLLGGSFGFAIGSNIAPQRKGAFILGGAIGFWCSAMLIMHLLTRLTGGSLPEAGVGIYFFLSFAFPILSGLIFSFFMGFATRNWRSIIRWLAWGGFAYLAGFCANRISAGLVASYMLNAFPPVIFESGGMILFIYVFVSYILQGLFLGMAFGRMTHKSILLAI